MINENFIQSQKDNHPNYDYLGSYTAGIPIYKLLIKVNVQRPFEIPLVGQFILRLIQNKINHEQIIAEALGLEIDFIRASLIELDKHRLINRQYNIDTPKYPIFTTTKKGIEAIKRSLITNYTEEIQIIVNSLIGDIQIADRIHLHDGPTLKNQNIILFHPIPEFQPTSLLLSQKISKIASLYKNRADFRENIGEINDILNIQSSRLYYHLVDILVFYNHSLNRLDFMVFENYQHKPMYDSVILRREREGQKVIPQHLLIQNIDGVQSSIYSQIENKIEYLVNISKEVKELKIKEEILDQGTQDNIQDSEIITFRRKRIRELEEELEKKGSVRILSNEDHREKLDYAIRNSKQRLVIISPWIKKDSVDREFIKQISNRISDGVKVFIGYGMPLKSGQTPKDYIDTIINNEFNKLINSNFGANLIVKHLGTHEKILICDNRFCIVTSFNFLSYRGNQGFRREMGVYSEDYQTINTVSESILSQFK